jgi:YHS domain-containing protein
LLTDAVASALTDGEMTEPVGVRMLRGAAQPVRLFRVRRDERRDPVCNAVVVSPPAAQLRRDGEDLWFCSQACLRRFLDGLEQGTALA